MANIATLTEKGIKVVKVRGDEILAHCPFHKDEHPSFSANLRKQVFVCFGCGKKGTFAQLGIAPTRDVCFGDFLTLLESEDSIEERVFALPHGYIPIEKRNFITAMYWDYLVNDRDITPDAIRHFQLGLCTAPVYRERIIIPLETGFAARSIWNERMGRLMSGRSFKKWLYPLGLPVKRTLFNFDPEQSVLMLVEGSFDVIKLFCHGIHAVAVHGCQISKEQIHLICTSKADKVYLCFDSDDAGEDGMDEVAYELMSYFGEERIFIVHLPEDEDPGSCDRKRLLKAMRNATPLVSRFDEYFEL